MIKYFGFGDSETEFSVSAMKLFNVDITCTFESGWFSQFWKCPATPEEIWDAFSVKEIRFLRDEHSERLSILIHKVVDRLSLRKEPLKCTTNEERQEVLNCTRILTRIIPVLFEIGWTAQASEPLQEHQRTVASTCKRDLVNNLFWKETPVTLYRQSNIAVDTVNTKGTSTDDLDVEFALEIDSQVCEDVSGQSNAPTTKRRSLQRKHSIPLRSNSSDSLGNRVVSDIASSSAHVPIFSHRMLGQRLMDAIVTLAFVPNFCVSAPAKSNIDETNFPAPCLWTKGVGITEDTENSESIPISSQSHYMYGNRSELISLFLVCISGSLYVEPRNYKNCTNDKFVVNFCTVPHRLKSCFIASILNTFCEYDPVGYGIPFSSLVSSDYLEEVATPCVHVLIALFSYQPRTLSIRGADKDAIPSQVADVNLFMNFITEMNQNDCSFVLSSLHRMLLLSPKPSFITAQPGFSLRAEVLIILWRLLSESEKFLTWSVASEDIVDFIEPILQIALDNQNNFNKLGIVHIAAFTLLALSSNRTFGVALNIPVSGTTGLEISTFSGHHGDMLLLGVHKIITHGHVKLSVIHDHLLRVFSNVAPFLKTFSKVAATKFVALFEVFSSPRYVCASPYHPNLLYYILEGLNSLVQYHFDGNVSVAYAILRRRDLFENLDKLTEPPLAKVLDQTSNRESDNSEVPHGEGEQLLNDTSTGKDAIGRRLSFVVNQSGWAPTAEWIQSWKASIPLSTSLILVRSLGPKVDDYCERNDTSESDIVDLLKAGTIVGLLPRPSQIYLRKYQPERYDGPWLAAFLWGLMYVKYRKPGLWLQTSVKLFEVKYAKRSE
eukprot:CFRG5454T1